MTPQSAPQRPASPSAESPARRSRLQPLPAAAAALLLAVAAQAAAAQDAAAQDAGRWDVAQELGPSRTISFETAPAMHWTR
jgi:hypothetical protein